MIRLLVGPARIPCLVVVVVVTLLLGYRAATLGIEHDNASLIAKDAVGDRVYADFKKAFGNDEDLIVAVEHPALLSADGLRTIDALTHEIEGIDGVRRVWSLTTAEEIVHGTVGAEPRLLAEPPLDAPDVGGRVAAALGRNPDFTGWLISADRKTAGLVVEIEDRPEDESYRTDIITTIRTIGARLEPQGTLLHLAGLPVQKHDVSDYVDRDQRLLLPLAVVILAATLGIFFRTLSGVAVPLGVAGITVVWTLGIYSLAGHELNAITSLLPPVLLVIALVGSIHVYDIWREGYAGGSDRRSRVEAAVRLVAAPACLCAVTTAQGFLSLGVSSMPAVQQFGMYAALGATVSFLVSMTAAPALLTFFTTPPEPAAAEHRTTTRLLDRTSHFATTRPRTVLAIFALITLVAVAAIPLVHSETDLVGFLPEDAALRRDTVAIDTHLGGAQALEFMMRRRDDGTLVEPDAMFRLAALESAIREHEYVTGTVSFTALLRQMHRAESGTGAFDLPRDQGVLAGYVDLLDESGHALVRRFLSADHKAARLSVRLRAVGTSESSPLVRQVLADAERILGERYELRPTGALYHVIRDSEHLVTQQVQSFGAAIVLVVLAIGLLFRSLKFTIIALIPNVMPIVWTGGLMGFAGIDLSTGTAMIASAVLGLVVDDTIHFLSHYRRNYRGNAAAAIHIATREVGAPVTVAAASLVLGFWVGAFGSFQPTIYFSLLTGLTMITGVLCDLLVLPATLVLMDD